MLRSLFLLICLIAGTQAIAQHTSMGTAKNTQKPADAKIDYKQMGAPIHSFILLPFHGVKEQNTVEQAKAQSLMTAKERRKAHKKDLKEAEAKMAFSKNILTEKDFDNGANLFVMMFNPTCGHCTDETQILERNIALFKKGKIILMANPSMKAYLDNFVKSFHTDDYFPTINVGMDSVGFMNYVFLYTSLPQINIYNEERKLIKTFTGEVVIDSLKKYIE